MDLDNEELEATRRLNGLAKTTADKMFEEIGYRLLPKDPNKKGILLHYIRDCKLSANESEHILFYYDKTFEGFYTYCASRKAFNIHELQAINKKCKELGWLDECN